jgi:hypothetical protein
LAVVPRRSVRRSNAECRKDRSSREEAVTGGAMPWIAGSSPAREEAVRGEGLMPFIVGGRPVKKQ